MHACPEPAVEELAAHAKRSPDIDVVRIVGDLDMPRASV